MSDNYQAVYDAVRSRIGNCDFGSAVQDAMRQASLDHYASQAIKRGNRRRHNTSDHVYSSSQSASLTVIVGALCMATTCKKVSLVTEIVLN